jgi:hypothetical protein
MWSFGVFCDEFYVNTRLYLKLDLDPSRETLLHFMEQIRRAFPRMSRLRRRDDGGLVLDEANREGQDRRFVRIDASALRFGNFHPSDADAVSGFANMILRQAPHHLSLSELDYDYMEVAFGFDLEYRGNHDELVAETLFSDHPLLCALTSEEEHVIDCQPFFGVKLTDDCEKQIYLEVKGRTSTYEIRTGEYESTALSVYLTARRYWGFAADSDLMSVHRDLLMTGEQYAADCAVPHVVQPLAAAIASRR